MNAKKRFMIGGAGALMPIFITVLSIDLVMLFNNETVYTTGHIVGFLVRYITLFTLGGVIAWLHEDEEKPYKLFQIGIAAPALVTSFVAANGINASVPGGATNISLAPEYQEQRLVISRRINGTGFC